MIYFYLTEKRIPWGWSPLDCQAGLVIFSGAIIVSLSFSALSEQMSSSVKGCPLYSLSFLHIASAGSFPSAQTPAQVLPVTIATVS